MYGVSPKTIVFPYLLFIKRQFTSSQSRSLWSSHDREMDIKDALAVRTMGCKGALPVSVDAYYRSLNP